MLALLPIIANLAPALAGFLFGDKAEATAAGISKIATDLFGSADKDTIEAAIARDPALALAFKSKLIEQQQELARQADAERDRTHQQRLAEYADIQSARAREIATKDVFLPKLALSILCLFGVVVLTVLIGSGLLLVGRVTIVNVDVAMTVMTLIGGLVGYVTNSTTQVLTYYFGSSSGSKDKSDTLSAALTASVKPAGDGIAARAPKVA